MQRNVNYTTSINNVLF